MKHICRYCGGGDATLYTKATSTLGDSFTYYRCHRCRSVFISPPPTAQQLAAAYDDSYYGEKDEKFPGLTEKILDGFRRSRARRASRLLKTGDSVLDIGCGNGRFLGHLASLGKYECHGIELPGKAADRAARIPGLNLHRGQLSPELYPTETFSLITLFHVLEHLPEPQATLKLAARLLRPGGHLLLSLPNIESNQARLFRGHWLHLDPPRHLCLPPTNLLINETTAWGLSKVGFSTFSPEQNPFGLVQSTLNATQMPRDLLYERLKSRKSYVPEYSKLSVSLQKLFAIILAPLALTIDAIESRANAGASYEILVQKK